MEPKRHFPISLFLFTSLHSFRLSLLLTRGHDEGQQDMNAGQDERKVRMLLRLTTLGRLLLRFSSFLEQRIPRFARIFGELLVR